MQEEYDIAQINGDALAVIEVKSKAHVSGMGKLVNRKIPNFQKLFNVYKEFPTGRNYELYGVIASFINDDA